MADEATVPEGAAEVEIIATDAPEDTSTRGAVERAFAKAFAPADESPATEASPEPEASVGGPARGADGKFVARTEDATAAPVSEPVAADPDPQPVAAPEQVDAHQGAPQRLSPDARAAWGTTPPAVRAEVSRAFTEMERGLNEYRARYEPIRAIAEKAAAQGQTLTDVVAHYEGIEGLLRANPVGGLDRICQNMGLSLREVAAHVLGQPVERDAEMHGLRQQAAAMQSELTRYRAQEQRAMEQRQAEALETVQKFAAAQPRFEELSPTITWLLKTDGAKNLDEAYALAERLRPAPAPAAPAATPAPVATPAATAALAQPVAHTPKKAGISIDGAPGSNPTVRPASKSTREALARAAAATGLSI